ncbi:MAG: hypothetical protein V3T49_08575 [Dehalococcoidia bacterium]
MIITVATISPKPANIAEVQGMVVDWVDRRNGQGKRVVGTRNVWAADGTKFHIASFHESVGDADDNRRANLASDDFIKVAQKLSTLINAPTGWTISERLIAPAQPRVTGYALRVGISPAFGKIMEMRQVSSDWVNYLNGIGVSCGLTMQIWGHNGPTFAHRLPHATLGDADDSRKQIQTDPEYKNFIEKLIPTMAGPPRWEIQEVIAGPAE